MRRFFLLLPVVILVCANSAFGQLVDPQIAVGPVGADCNASPDPCSGHPTQIGATGFVLDNRGAGTSTGTPWYILLAIANTNAVDPTITGTGFTIGAGQSAGDFNASSGGDIYSFAASLTGGLGGDNSMNFVNMAGADQTIDGITASFFDIIVYKVTSGELVGHTDYTFGASPNLPVGTFVAGLGLNGSNQFSTPFTTAGLVTQTTTTTATASGPASGPLVPEPSTITLLGTALLAACTGLRKKLARA